MKTAFLFLAFILFGVAPVWPASNDVETLRRILRENPDIVLDVLRQNSEAVLDIAQQGSNLRRKYNLEAQWRADMEKKKDVRLDNRPVLGNPNARVKIIAFSDFSCHFCQQASKTVDAILKEYGDDVALIFKNLPLDDKGPGADASAWFVAISRQSAPKAWEFYRAMYANRDKLLSEGNSFIEKTASGLGVDIKKAKADIESPEVKNILSQDQDDGQKLGVEGTPYFLVNDLVVRGALPLDLFRGAVDMALGKTK